MSAERIEIVVRDEWNNPHMIEVALSHGFGVHRMIHDRTLWAVTHLPTRLVAVGDVKNARRAHMIACRLASLGLDWTFTDPTAVKSFPNYLLAHIAELHTWGKT